MTMVVVSSTRRHPPAGGGVAVAVVMAMAMVVACFVLNSQPVLGSCVSRPSHFVPDRLDAMGTARHCYNTSSDTSSCFLRCACDGEDVDPSAVHLTCSPTGSSADDVPGFVYWNISVHDAHVNFTFSSKGKAAPSPSSGSTASFASSGVIATTSTPSELELEAEYDPHLGASMQTNMFWTPCRSMNAVSASRRIADDRAHVTVGWSRPDTTSDLLDHMVYDIAVRNTTHAAFETVVSGIAGRHELAAFQLPLGCEQYAVRVRSRFVASNGTTLASCASPYSITTVAPAATPSAPGTASVDMVHLTSTSAAFTWGPTSHDGGCGEVTYRVVVLDQMTSQVMGSASAKGMHNTHTTVTFAPPLKSRAHYIVEVRATTPIGSSPGTQSVFTAPAHTSTRTRTGRIVGSVVGSVVAVAIVITIFLLQRRNRKRVAYERI
ncbi:hypothetical protein PTSG_07459 [Salpingoeca rosetta]|uniref:Fibronectin type-III domain-containing protein n=1 Tax=Salpingoeca rosetta (strain ATCC 50818 / BSB-021) TaxID=946362 RepID=F2UIS5_SALR5|nr:uncharacterized protein PTSG_07459 [Salpingoeca rosetta]EGD77124.1 hypothetical protein PTSG_07459 [Salpingoeca rosetta]|eukprot:XP_004990963.1 hypothetical protein PTSG_07459 [Salpingoeca rosetta]